MPTGKYLHGEEVTITAIPDECCEFLYWVDEKQQCFPVSYEENFTFRANSDITYVPVFRKKKYRVEISANLKDFCCIIGNGIYDCGENVDVYITIADCNNAMWENEYLNANSEIITTEPGKTTLHYEIQNINEDFLENVLISLTSYMIEVEPCQPDYGSAIIITGENTINHNTSLYICDGETAELTEPCDYKGVVNHGKKYLGICGSEVSIIATPFKGYIFNGWVESEDCIDCQGPYTYTSNAMPMIINSDRKLIACFSNNNNT